MQSPNESEHARAKVLPLPRVTSVIALSKNGVTNEYGDDLGRIEDVMVDIESGRVAFAVISASGGLLGREPRMYAVPWSALKVSLHDKKVILNVAKDTIANAPSFHRNSWPDLSNLSWLREIYAYYGVQPYWND
jgi:sporulation protein YlmC with PRC-barrel domain